VETSSRKPLKLFRLKERPADPLKKRRRSKMLNQMRRLTPAAAAAHEHLLAKKRRRKMPLKPSARRGLKAIARSSQLLQASLKRSLKMQSLKSRRRARLRLMKPASKRSLSENTYI